MKPVACRLVW